MKGYADTFLPLFNNASKTERNHKRKVERLSVAAEEVVKITDFLLTHAKIKELSDAEATSIETVLFLASDLDISKRKLVIEYIYELNKIPEMVYGVLEESKKPMEEFMLQD